LPTYTVSLPRSKPLTLDDYVIVDPTYNHAVGGGRPVQYFEELFQVHEDLWLGAIDSDLCDAIMNACEPRGENFVPERSTGRCYAFVRKDPPFVFGRYELDFDRDTKLRHFVARSRVLHPTAADCCFAASVATFEDGSRQICPRGLEIEGHAYVLDQDRNWLLPGDVSELRALIQVPNSILPGRIISGLWFLEAVFNQYFIDIRLPMVATGIEAIVKIKDEKGGGSKQNFVRRLLAIGRRIPSLAMTEAELSAMYERRSDLVHGMGTFEEFTDGAERDLYRKQEGLFRGILRAAILDEGFREAFRTDQSLAEAFPL